MPRPTNTLIVDDEPHVRTFLRRVLKEPGIEQTWEAGDGEQALAGIEQHRPELVLLDVNMPLINGLEVLKRAKELDPDPAVIVVTSESSLKTVQEAVRLGASSYVLKHRPKNDVGQAVGDALDALEDEGSDDHQADETVP